MEIRKAIGSDALNISALGMFVCVDTYATTGVFNKISKYIHAELTENRILEIIENKTVYVCFKETGEMYFDLYGDKIRNVVLENTQK